MFPLFWYCQRLTLVWNCDKTLINIEQKRKEKRRSLAEDGLDLSRKLQTCQVGFHKDFVLKIVVVIFLLWFFFCSAVIVIFLFSVTNQIHGDKYYRDRTSESTCTIWSVSVSPSSGSKFLSFVQIICSYSYLSNIGYWFDLECFKLDSIVYLGWLNIWMDASRSNPSLTRMTLESLQYYLRQQEVSQLVISTSSKRRSLRHVALLLMHTFSLGPPAQCTLFRP